MISIGQMASSIDSYVIAPETQLQQQARGMAGGLGDYQKYLTHETNADQ